jgi:uncharacterized protein YjiS (DUF1127 family)
MSQALTPAQIVALNSQYSMPVAARLAVWFAVMVTTWDTRWRTRRTLKGLEDHVLNDIGLDHFTAQAEASKPFWQG